MSRIFEVDTHVNAYSIVAPWHPEFDPLELGDGRMAENWSPMSCRMAQDQLPTPEFVPFAASGFACNAVSKAVINDIEWLPLVCNGNRYDWVHVVSVADCLIEEKCHLNRLPDGQVVDYGRNTYCVSAPRIGHANIFHIAVLQSFTMFCTASFVDIVRRFDLGGLVFHEHILD